MASVWDHPRVCGEKRNALVIIRSFRGSPPRMRGKETDGWKGLGEARITPAYAGKRRPWLSSRWPWRDHPRVCGEKFGLSLRLSVRRGSPPRMRGKVAHVPAFVLCVGITPAYAGKSAAGLSIAGSIWDHPRVCGEKDLLLDFAKDKIGSPPRMRGKETKKVGIRADGGITPAYAGKSLWKLSQFQIPKDHPRVCGEKARKSRPSQPI